MFFGSCVYWVRRSEISGFFTLMRDLFSLFVVLLYWIFRFLWFEGGVRGVDEVIGVGSREGF